MYKQKYYKYKNKYNNLKNILSIGGNVSMDMSYDNRINYYNLLNNNLKDDNDCLGKNIPLKKGGHGSIYKKIIKKDNKIFEISIKEQKTDKNTINNKFNINNKIWLEYDILKKSTELNLNKTTQNLPIIYDYNICKTENTILLYNELATGSFLDWCYESHTEDEWKSFLFQFWVGIYTLQKYLRLVHNDLRLGNVLYHKIEKKENEYWKYSIDGTDYYIPNEGYVFIIWDFGSSNLIKSDTDVNKQKLDLNIDLHFFHDLYNRLRVLLLLDKYTTKELETMFISNKEVEYIKNKKQECERRFRRDGRYDEKYKIALVYYLIENNKFDELNKKQKITINKVVQIPPDNIMNILKDLSENNYNYDDVLKILYKSSYKIKQVIPSPKILIGKYFNEYKIKKPTSLEFKI